MIRQLFIPLLFAFCLAGPAFAGKDADFEAKVRAAITRQMEKYPESTLRDIYKNFFQDRFGPGHMIADPGAARQYLQRELNAYDKPSEETAEPTGWQHNYYRVSLSVIKSGKLSSEALVDALVRSANAVEPVSIKDWKNEWMKIEAIIGSMGLILPDYEKDLKEINDRLDEGIYVGHHSQAYNEAYAPHYRIISREVFEKEIQPLLK